MQAKRLPFNISLLNPDKARLAALMPVQSMDIYDSNKMFHSQGLYSTEVFGNIGTPIRQAKHSFIDLRTIIMHPKIYKDLGFLKGLYKGIMSGKDYAVWDDTLKDFVKSDIMSGRTGYSFFMEHFKDIILRSNDSNIREMRIKLLNKTRDNCLYRYLVVIPAGLRDIERGDDGRDVEDEINPLYRRAIRISNTLSINEAGRNDPLYDVARASLQNAFNDIYQYIESILDGKYGLLLAKMATRAIHGGTRNVITAIDPSPRELGAIDAFTVNDTGVGLFQYMKGTNEQTIYDIKMGPLSPMIKSLPGTIRVINKKTLESEDYIPPQWVTDLWGSNEGLEKVINQFEKQDKRHKPIEIDGRYVALVYKDAASYKVFYDIRELPEGFEKDKVSPITWCEMLYISVYEHSRSPIGYLTRYPIEGTGSIYPSFLYVRTTVTSKLLRPLDDNWKIDNGRYPAINYPITGLPFFDSLSIHPNKCPGAGADYDGDKMSLNIAVSEEAIREGKEYLNSKKAFISIDGKLRYGFNTDIGNLLLHCFSCGLEEQNRVEIQELSSKDTYIADIALTIASETTWIEDSTKAKELDRLKLYTNGKNLYFAILLYGETVGLIRVAVTSATECSIGMGILQVHTQKGIGKEALSEALELIKEKGIKKVFLHVDVNNYGAAALYKSLGFIVTGEGTETNTKMVKYI